MDDRHALVNSFNMPYNQMIAKRKYVLKDRAEHVLETRRRIVEAAVGLHLEIGPAATQVAEIARRAGVQRVTVYNHFPADGALFAACSAHWRALHPTPDTTRWLETANAGERARLALAELYGWYRETAPMTGNVLRDAQALPPLRAVIEGGLLRYLGRAAETIAEPFRVGAGSARRVDAAARAAVDFHFWQALESLGDEDAAALGSGLINLAAQPLASLSH